MGADTILFDATIAGETIELFIRCAAGRCGSSASTIGRRASLAHVEVPPGVLTVVACSMLAASDCAGVAIGAPGASLSVPRDLGDP